MKNRKTLLTLVLCALAIMCFGANVKAEETGADEKKTIARTIDVTLINGQYHDFMQDVNNALMPDEYSDYEGCSAKPSKATVSSKKVLKLTNNEYNNDSDYMQVINAKVLKVGKATMTVKGIYVESSENEDGDTVSTEYSFEVKIKVKVISQKDANKDAAKLAKKILKKASKNTKFAFVDLNFDGYKDLVVGNKVYQYIPKMILDPADEVEPSYYMQITFGENKKWLKNAKLKKVYLDKKAGTYVVDYKLNKDTYTTGDARFMSQFDGRCNLYRPTYNFVKLNSKGVKKYGRQWIDLDLSDSTMESNDTITHKQFQKITRKYANDKTPIKMYKNTSANVKKYVK